MANMQERLDRAVEQTEVDSGIFHHIVHGKDIESVTTENGKIPTIAKAIKDIQGRVYDETYNIVEIAQNAADTATQKANDCTGMTNIVANYTAQNKQYVTNMQTLMEGSDEEVQALGGKHSCEQWVKLAQQSTTGSYPTTISGVADVNQTILPIGESLSVSTQILAVIIENTLLLPNTYTLSADCKNVVLSNQLSIGERWSVQYLTDFQSIASIDNTIIYEEMETE